MKYDATSDSHVAVLVEDDGCTVCTLSTPNPNAAELARDLVSMRETLARAIEVIEDFMPNIGQCVLQDYGRLNDVLCESSQLLKRYP